MTREKTIGLSATIGECSTKKKCVRQPGRQERQLLIAHMKATVALVAAAEDVVDRLRLAGYETEKLAEAADQFAPDLPRLDLQPLETGGAPSGVEPLLPGAAGERSSRAVLCRPLRASPEEPLSLAQLAGNGRGPSFTERTSISSSRKASPSGCWAFRCSAIVGHSERAFATQGFDARLRQERVVAHVEHILGDGH